MRFASLKLTKIHVLFRKYATECEFVCVLAIWGPKKCSRTVHF